MSNSQTGNETIHDLVGFHETIGLLNQVVQGNLPDSQYVIALNAEWGSGKTFFLNQWATHLRGEMKDGTNRGIDPVFINAWENDLLNDPLPCILEAISTRFQKHAVTMKGLLDAGTFLMKRLSVAGLKALTLTLVDADKEIEKGIETAVEQSANKAIADVISTRVQLDEFKTQLGNLAAEVADETGFPLLIFLDELDRCRPDFALRMLETIKHLFNVRGVVFVIAIDRKQLAASTQAIYGPDFDGPFYLDRFFNFEIGIPKRYEKFIATEWDRRALEKPAKQFACETIKFLATIHKPNYRSLQRFLNRLKIAQARFRSEIPDLVPNDNGEGVMQVLLVYFVWNSMMPNVPVNKTNFTLSNHITLSTILDFYSGKFSVLKMRAGARKQFDYFCNHVNDNHYAALSQACRFDTN